MNTPPTNCPVTDIDPWADDALIDPYPTYRALRDLGSVVWLDRYGLAALPRFADVRAALTDHQRFSSASGACVDEQRAREMGESILTSDPPVHERYRKPIKSDLNPDEIVAMGAARMAQNFEPSLGPEIRDDAVLRFDPQASTEGLTDTHIKDVVSHTLGIGLKDDVYDPLVEKDHVIPPTYV